MGKHGAPLPTHPDQAGSEALDGVHEHVPGRVLDQRVMELMGELQKLTADRDIDGVAETIVTDLVERVADSVQSAFDKGERNALVVQFADLVPATRENGGPNPSMLALNAIARGLGAHVTQENGSRIDVTSENIHIFAERGMLQQTAETGVMTTNEGSYLVKRSHQAPDQEADSMVLETDIPGVRLWLEGPMVQQRGQTNEAAIRPMLLVSTEEELPVH